MFLCSIELVLLQQTEAAGSTELHHSLESSVTQLQQNLKQRDIDCSKMKLEVQVSSRHSFILSHAFVLYYQIYSHISHAAL